MSQPHYLELLNQERKAMYELLANLGPEQLAMPSLCEHWTIEDVAYHMASWPYRFGSYFRSARLSWLMARTGSMDGVNQWFIDKWRRQGFEKVLIELAHPWRMRTNKASLQGVLAELFIHAQDIRRPLGMVHRYSTDGLTAVLNDLLASTSWAGAWTNAVARIEGLRLRAADVDWTHGTGLHVTGPAEAIIMVAHGRRAALGDLAGPGVKILASRSLVGGNPLQPRRQSPGERG